MVELGSVKNRTISCLLYTSCGDAKNEVVFAALGALRCECAKRLDLLNPREFKFLWVTEFPMFEWSEEENRFVAMHLSLIHI